MQYDRVLAATDNQPLMAPGAISEIPTLTSTSIPTDGGGGSDESTIFMGNFSRIMIGVRSDIRVDVSRDFALDRLQYVMVCHMRMDVAVSHATAFHTVTGVQG